MIRLITFISHEIIIHNSFVTSLFFAFQNRFVLNPHRMQNCTPLNSTSSGTSVSHDYGRNWTACSGKGSIPNMFDSNSFVCTHN